MPNGCGSLRPALAQTLLWYLHREIVLCRYGTSRAKEMKLGSNIVNPRLGKIKRLKSALVAGIPTCFHQGKRCEEVSLRFYARARTIFRVFLSQASSHVWKNLHSQAFLSDCLRQDPIKYGKIETQGRTKLLRKLSLPPFRLLRGDVEPSYVCTRYVCTSYSYVHTSKFP